MASQLGDYMYADFRSRNALGHKRTIVAAIIPHDEDLTNDVVEIDLPFEEMPRPQVRLLNHGWMETVYGSFLEVNRVPIYREGQLVAFCA